MPLRMGPMGRGGARRRTRRRQQRKYSKINEQQQAEIEKAKGKSIDNMSDAELEEEMKKRGIEILEDEEGGGSDKGEGPDTDDYAAELEKLAGLRDKGIITEEEFQAKKKQILGL